MTECCGVHAPDDLSRRLLVKSSVRCHLHRKVWEKARAELAVSAGAVAHQGERVRASGGAHVPG